MGNVIYNGTLSEGFTIIPNEINYEKISVQALGIYIKILRLKQKGENEINISLLKKVLKDDEETIKRGLKELKDLGYIDI